MMTAPSGAARTRCAAAELRAAASSVAPVASGYRALPASLHRLLFAGSEHDRHRR